MAFPSPDADSRWCAVALEMDIWGFGDTAKQAMEDLDELIEIQIEFAVGKKALGVLDHPTEKKWFDLWNALQKFEKEHAEERKSLAHAIEARASSVPNIPEQALAYSKAA